MALPDVTSLTLGDDKSNSSEHRIRTDLYEERKTPLSGIGVFATALIQSGTRVFCEDPLFLLPYEAHQVHLYKTIKALPGGKETEFWALAPSLTPSKDISQIETLREFYGGNTNCEKRRRELVER